MCVSSDKKQQLPGGKSTQAHFPGAISTVTLPSCTESGWDAGWAAGTVPVPVPGTGSVPGQRERRTGLPDEFGGRSPIWQRRSGGGWNGISGICEGMLG